MKQQWQGKSSLMHSWKSSKYMLVPPASTTACFTGFNKVLLFLFHISLQNVADAKHLGDLHINSPQFSKDHKSDWKMMKTSSRIIVSVKRSVNQRFVVSTSASLLTIIFKWQRIHPTLQSTILSRQRMQNSIWALDCFTKWLQCFRGLYHDTSRE